MEFSFRVLGVHQHLLALLRMTVFGIIFPFCSESSEEMSRFMSHCAVGDQRDTLFGISGAIVGSSSVCHSGINGPFQRTEADVCRKTGREKLSNEKLLLKSGSTRRCLPTRPRLGRQTCALGEQTSKLCVCCFRPGHLLGTKCLSP